ncbi:MAG: alpha/beta fold hydrolase [Ignavibacteriae bacterium]|nr:alpha/beta fold hydrolase [Ignavibacteriota bacterium]
MKQISSTLVHRVLPPEQSNAAHHPTLIMLHGRGADEEDLLGLSQYFDSRLLILSVRAPYPFPYGGGYTWYDIGAVGAPELTMFKTSYEKLSAFVSDALAQYPVDTKQVYLLGFSMGTVMSYSMALTQPQLFRAVIANSGYVPEGTHLSFLWDQIGHLDFFIAHGTFDPVIPVQLGRRAKELLESAKARLSYKEYPMAHQISEESLHDMAAWLNAILNT